MDYTAKLVIGIKNGRKYYDHELTEIEKGHLIQTLNALAKHVDENQMPSISDIKDTRLVSILQTNSSKIVDENGEPLVVYRGAVIDPLERPKGEGVIAPQGYFTADKDYAVM